MVGSPVRSQPDSGTSGFDEDGVALLVETLDDAEVPRSMVERKKRVTLTSLWYCAEMVSGENFDCAVGAEARVEIFEAEELVEAARAHAQRPLPQRAEEVVVAESRRGRAGRCRSSSRRRSPCGAASALRCR